jgi:hypothetical protein
MKRVEVEQMKIKLDEILKKEDVNIRRKELEVLAKEVEASITRMESVQIGEKNSKFYYEQRNVTTEAEIVHNIQEPLQTHVMINMSKTSAHSFWIAVGAMLIALFAMMAAWAVVVVKVKCGG